MPLDRMIVDREGTDATAEREEDHGWTEIERVGADPLSWIRQAWSATPWWAKALGVVGAVGVGALVFKGRARAR